MAAVNPDNEIFESRSLNDIGFSNYNSWTIGTKATYALKREPGRYEIFLNGAVEFWMTDYSDFTDLRTGSLYSYNATVLQLYVTALF